MAKRRQDREALELAAFLRRMGRALVRRAGDGDLDALVALVDSRAALDVAIGDAARALHTWRVDGVHDGYSWAEIGRAVGISKQAAQQRFGEVDPCRI